jgi:hypothetical protein
MELTKKQQYHRDYHKQWYEKNKERRKAQIHRRVKDLRKWLNDFKQTLVCACGEDHPATLDFHHVDGREKVIAVADTWKNGWSKERMAAEMAKCVVVCSNCHRKHHHEEREAALGM